MRPPPSNNVAKLAFTLIELLVVITVISLLLAFSAPALFNGLQASRLSGAGERMVSSLSDAQQTAFSENCVVEVQFYSYQGQLGSGIAYRGYRVFKVTTPNTAAGLTNERIVSVGAIINLPDGVIISADPGLSPALAGATLDDTQNNAGVANAQYTAIRFLPDGTCRKVSGDGGGGGTGTGGTSPVPSLSFLPLTDSFFTMVEDDGRVWNAGAPPANFFTIQTDPYTGKSRSYRPGF